MLWWIKYTLLILLALFFLYFGIEVLIAAYGLNEPFSFILAFFASNLIILISLALAVGFVYRMIAVYKHLKMPPNEPESSHTDHR